MDIEMLNKMSNNIRFLAADMVQNANSGHPGAAMGLADIATVLSSHLKHNPKNPTWLNRDRLIFSGGHVTPLIYSLFYLWGYDLEIDDLKKFRKLNSKTPGHPEYRHTKGVEITTGPLGQGVANSVGFSMASKYLATKFNEQNFNFIDHHVYCFCGDGDLQEGISYEAASIAGHQKLDNLIMIYDSNNITIEGSTDLSISEDIKARFQAQAWQVLEIDGHDFKEIDNAFIEAKKADKPVIIIANTTIAKGSNKFEGSHHAHGAPLGDEDIAISKIKANFNFKSTFHVDDDVLIRFRSAIDLGDLAERQWNYSLKTLPNPKQSQAINELLNPSFDHIKYPIFNDDISTRDSNGKIINEIARALSGFLGGSADLGPSNKTTLKNMGSFPEGKNIYFGVREHAMASITNAIALYGPLIPFSSTFFVFSDYMKPSVRVAALAGIQHFFIWTHDSIGVGEDGPTHQPIEHLSQFRALPNCYVFRPADGFENVQSWKKALTLKTSPSAFVCSRQKLPKLPNKPIIGSISQGGYLLAKSTNATVTLMASGSEVSLALDIKKILKEHNINSNVVSVPCFDLLIEQDQTYIDSIIKLDTRIYAIEAARSFEWYRFAHKIFNMDSFGASAPAKELFRHFNFNATTIADFIKKDNKN